MGGTSSVEAATAEAEYCKSQIDRKCNSYVLSIEHTNSVVDITLDGLRKEIFALIDPLRSSKNLVDLGMEDLGAVLQGVEHHANTQKFVIQRLLDILFEAQSTFEELSDYTMASADVDDVPEVLLDEGVMTTMRLIIEDLLHGYEKELQGKGPVVSEMMTRQRCDELHRLLFKLAEVTVSEMVESTVSEMKNTFLEDIDHMVSSSMLTGQFKQALAAKECLQTIISKSLIARVSLEALPFSRRVEVEAGQEEIEQFVDDLVRKVQMYHSNEATVDFEQLMHLDLDYSESDGQSDDDSEGSDSSSSSDDNSTEPDCNSEDGTDIEEVVPVPKTRPKPTKKSPQTKKTPSKVASKKNPPKKAAVSESKPPASAKKTPAKPVRNTRKRKDTATPVDDEVSVTEKRATRSRRQ